MAFRFFLSSRSTLMTLRCWLATTSSARQSRSLPIHKEMSCNGEQGESVNLNSSNCLERRIHPPKRTYNAKRYHMTDSVLAAQIEAANAYEALFVPALFQQWTSIVLEAANVSPGDRVLDVACGTGVLARQAQSLVGEDGEVTGLDVTPGMLKLYSRFLLMFSVAEYLQMPNNNTMHAKPPKARVLKLRSLRRLGDR